MQKSLPNLILSLTVTFCGIAPGWHEIPLRNVRAASENLCGRLDFGGNGLTPRVRAWRGYEPQEIFRDFPGGDGLHAPKIEWTVAEKAGAAFDLMAEGDACRGSRPGQAGFGGTEEGN